MDAPTPRRGGFTLDLSRGDAPSGAPSSRPRARTGPPPVVVKTINLSTPKASPPLRRPPPRRRPKPRARHARAPSVATHRTGVPGAGAGPAWPTCSTRRRSRACAAGPDLAPAVTNKQIGRQLLGLAELIELTGGNAFRARALASAGRAIERERTPVAARLADGTATDLPGVGKGVARDLAEIVETGTLSAAAALRATLPPGLPEVLRVKGLGVRKVRTLWTEAGVTSLDELEAAAASGRLAALPGFGARTAANVLASIAELRTYRGRRHLRDASRVASDLLARLTDVGIEAAVAGAVRRQCNTVAEVRLVARATAEALAAALPEATAGPDDICTLAEPDGFAAVVRSAPDDFGAALWRETGPPEHLAAVEARLGDGLPDASDAERYETAVYASAGLAFVPPPLRDDPHWLDVAARGPLPTLVTMDDLVGTLHNHTTASDGSASLAEMVDAAAARGLGYFGVCDHSQSLGIAHGLSVERLAAQRREVDALNARSGPVRVFAGSEVDVLADGSLDFPDDVLAGLDLVVASVHQGFRMSEDEATARVVRAVSNPYVDILGHPTARLLLRREGYPLDHLAVLDACAAHGVAVELNANPWRLDIDWRWVRHAVARGVPVAINPDAHAPDDLDNVTWGVLSAQKGGLTASDTLTSRDADALAAWLSARRPAPGAPGERP